MPTGSSEIVVRGIAVDVIRKDIKILLERHHNERFVALMDRFLPHWRALRNQLNRSPLAHEDWGY